jgi:hypothetical protein
MRKKWIAGLATCLVLGGGSIAVAQDVIGADGGPPGAPPGGAYTQQQCGDEQFNLVRTQSTPAVTSSTTFAGLPGSAFPFSVAANQSRCIKVVFTAETSCTDSNANDYCYVQAVIDGVPMNPNGQGFQAIDSEDPTASAHGYEWVARVGPGNHVLELEQRVRNNNTVFRIDDWTQDITIKL